MLMQIVFHGLRIVLQELTADLRGGICAFCGAEAQLLTRIVVSDYIKVRLWILDE